MVKAWAALFAVLTETVELCTEFYVTICQVILSLGNTFNEDPLVLVQVCSPHPTSLPPYTIYYSWWLLGGGFGLVLPFMCSLQFFLPGHFSPDWTIEQHQLQTYITALGAFPVGICSEPSESVAQGNKLVMSQGNHTSSALSGAFCWAWAGPSSANSAQPKHILILSKAMQRPPTLSQQCLKSGMLGSWLHTSSFASLATDLLLCFFSWHRNTLVNDLGQPWVTFGSLGHRYKT